MFYVGQKVVCINDTVELALGLARSTVTFVGGLDGLTKGQVYTIKEIIDDKTFSYKEKVLILVLDEIIRPVDTVKPANYSPGFISYRFRPLKETDISIFTAMLYPENIKKAKKELLEDA